MVTYERLLPSRKAALAIGWRSGGGDGSRRGREKPEVITCRPEPGNDETAQVTIAQDRSGRVLMATYPATAVGQEGRAEDRRRRLRLTRKGAAGSHHMSTGVGNDETEQVTIVQDRRSEYRSRGRAPMLESSHVGQSRATTRRCRSQSCKTERQGTDGATDRLLQEQGRRGRTTKDGRASSRSPDAGVVTCWAEIG